MDFCLISSSYIKPGALWKRTVSASLIILAGLILSPNLSQAGQKILAVQSIRVAPYEEALQGFQSACNADVEKLVLAEMQEGDIAKEVRKAHPDVILAVGMGALQKLKEIQDIPIVYLMVLNPESVLPSHANITGVSMNIPPEKQLATLLEVIPKVKKVGLVYDPEKSVVLGRKALEAAQKNGVSLITKEVHQATESLSAIKSLQRDIDVFWMVPDATVFPPEIIEFVLLSSLENRIPILTFAEKYVEMGAFMSIGIDAHDIGHQAAEMVQKIASGIRISQIQPIDARKAVVTINLKVAKKLGITVNKEILSEARLVE